MADIKIVSQGQREHGLKVPQKQPVLCLKSNMRDSHRCLYSPLTSLVPHLHPEYVLPASTHPWWVPLVPTEIDVSYSSTHTYEQRLFLAEHVVSGKRLSPS